MTGRSDIDAATAALSVKIPGTTHQLSTTPEHANAEKAAWVIDRSGARGRNRTTDTGIFNPLLYP